MTDRFVERVLVVMVVLFALWVTVVGLGAQASRGASTSSLAPPPAIAYPQPRTSGFKPPRTADGRPDLQGYWSISEYVDGSRVTSPIALDIQAHEENAWVRKHQSVVVDPKDGKVPYQEWALKKKSELVRSEFIEYIGGVDPHVKCYRNAPPRQIYAPGGVQILQEKDRVLIINEWDGNARIVPTDGRAHIGKRFSLFIGDPIGSWDGDTFVIDTTNLNGNAWLSANGDFTMPDLHIVERFTMMSSDRILYSATLDAPSVYTRPWTMAFRMVRNTEAGYQQMEFACHEGEKTLKNIQEAHPGAQSGIVVR